jgi:UDP-glucose 4-epimerase
MKCLVTGGQGFIGSHLVDNLIDLGNDVTVIDLNCSTTTDNFWKNDKAKYYKYDICDYELTRPLYEGVDWVFHLAAEVSIQESIINPTNTVRTNSLGTSVVLQCAKEANVKKVIYSSTSAAYGANSSPNIETQSEDCLNPYSVSKVSGEKLCKMYTNLYGLPTVIFRYFNVYGERQPVRGQYAPVVGIFLRQKDFGEPLTIVGDGHQRRDFIYVGDVVRANIMVASYNGDSDAYGEVYNVGSGTNYSVAQVARMISNETVNIAPRPGEARVSLANNQKIRKVFGWSPIMKLEDWIGSYL